MTTPETRLSGFLAYATARPTARAAAIRLAIGGDYKIEQDFYKRFRGGIEADRRGLRDGSAVEAAVTNATEKKVARFTHLAKQWKKAAPRWADCTPIDIEKAVVNIAGLGVSLRPSFAETRPDGTVEIVWVNYCDKGYTATDIDMVLRLFQRAYTPLHPDAVITVVDLSSGRVRTSEGVDLTKHDLRIDTDAAGLAYAMRNAA